ncbi:XRE family transcriptional regulator [Macrococcoides bohemicum]|uniref:helix-turn-helix domain-containing protein n=1 Tax=Macrococcoides bohemicum TaxID=1903056 RepID=UPI00105A66E7|nr:helix-turn-helix transcriptional regulator [Macrococcus bohemicus]TDL37016.1 XRE family transcriptional regulator [Macrococcus bohemicus]
MSFGKKLKEVRLREDISIRGLARLTNVSHAYISQLENSDNKQPTKNKLFEIAYALDPDGKKKIFEELIKETTLQYENADEEFQSYIESKNFDIDLNKISNKMLINKNENTLKELDYPFTDIEWLVNQDMFHIYMGNWPNNYVHNKKGEFVQELFVLNENEKSELKELIDTLKEKFVKDRNKSIDDIDQKEIEKMAKKYQFIEDLIRGKFETEDSIIEAIYDIDIQKKNIISQEYIDSLFNAVATDSANEILLLLNMNSLEDFQEYLNG